MLSFLYGPTLASICDYWENHGFDYMGLVGKIVSLLFNMLSRYCHGFSSKEQVSFNSMAAVAICSDFGAKKIKSVTVSIVSPTTLP